MAQRNNRQWLIALVAALIGLFLGLLCGALGGGALGFWIGRGPARTMGNWPCETPRRQWAPPVEPTLRPVSPTPPRLLQGGALVLEVLENTPAERAGLRPGDIIVSVDGQAVTAEQTLSELIAQHKPGERVSLQVQRQNGTMRVEVVLAENPRYPGQGYLGVRVQDLVR